MKLRASALVIAMALYATLAACPLSALGGDMNAKGAWTLLVYMAADNNLDPASLNDLREMMSVGSTDRVRIVALLDRLGGNGSAMYYVKKGGNETLWGGWSEDFELNTGSADTLVWFVRTATSLYPAEHYVLVLWDHGDSWRGFGWDDSNGDYLSMEEIGDALRRVGVEIDILGFDACLMASIEVAYTLGLTGKVGYIVASEETVPWDGWPYDRILERLVRRPDMTPLDLAVAIADEYIGSYTRGSQGFEVSVTISVVDARSTGFLVDQLGALTARLLGSIGRYKGSLKAASEKAERYWFGMWRQGPYVDLRDFLEKLLNMERDLEPYIDPILRGWSDTVIVSRSNLGPHVKGSYGLTVYFPRNKNQFYTPQPYYSSVPEFAERTGWYRLLRSVLG